MIGICVVYLAHDSDGFALLDLSVAQLKRTTRGAFRIYGCCPDNDAETCRRMALHGIEVQAAGERDPDISREHSRLLNSLVDRAVSDGCEFIATFDMDSWPIQADWNEFYAVLLTAQTPVASIVRTELCDNFPFSAFTIFGAGFWQSAQSSFNTQGRPLFSLEAAALSSRPGETGSGILAQLLDAGQQFLRLERSNTWNVHPIIAAVYDNTIFHLGAGSRTPRFITDEQTYQIGGDSARQRLADAMNMALRAFALAELFSRHDEFIQSLTGQAPRIFSPILTDPRCLPRSLALTPIACR